MKLKFSQVASCGLLAGTFFLCSTLAASVEPISIHVATYPPPPEPPVTVMESADTGSLTAAATIYSIGDPTPEEQLYLEMINRARANPAAEGLLFYNTTDPDVRASYVTPDWTVNLEEMKDQFSKIPPAPPLAMNAKLITAARRHSLDMFNRIFQSHTGSDGSSFASRVRDTGYTLQTLAENIYSHARSVFHGHAGFEVDWGPGENGMQNPPGHRNTIHNPDYREVGIGVVLGSKVDPANPARQVGPQLVTQEFARQFNSPVFVTGVVYFDLNGNNFYDLGEGISGITVSVEGNSTTAVTARSGGYAVPVQASPSYVVTFSGENVPTTVRTVPSINGANVKIDFTPTYSPPAIAGSAEAPIGKASNFSILPVPSAHLYEWRQFQILDARIEPAENTEGVSLAITAEYDVVETKVKKSGAASFHLAHVDPAPQTITLKPSFLIKGNSTLVFASRLGEATEDETARVQVSSDGGQSWQNIYSQAGSTPEESFIARSIDLSDFAGKTVQLRFVFDYVTGSYFPTAFTGYGWYLDDIQVQNASEISNITTADTTVPAFTFTPTAEIQYGLQARARAGHNFLEWGPVTFVQGIPAPPEVLITSVRKISPTELQIDFELKSGATPADYTVQSKSKIADPWTDTNIPIVSTGNGRFKAVVTLSPGTGSNLYRILAN